MKETEEKEKLVEIFSLKMAPPLSAHCYSIKFRVLIEM
jgi:hypothetical protein